MPDPRKPVFQPDHQQSESVRTKVRAILMAATEIGSEQMGMNGASFVITGIGVWATELAELDGRATARMLRAIATLFDPQADDNQMRRAEDERAKAARSLFAALDLQMAEAKGNG